MSALDQSTSAARTAARRTPIARMSDEELARLRAHVESGRPLSPDTEVGAVIAEMGRANDVTRPAATTLDGAVRGAEAEAGRELSPAEIQELWAANPGLRAVKALHDRERARWRVANAILEESNALEEMRRAGVPRFTSSADLAKGNAPGAKRGAPQPAPEPALSVREATPVAAPLAVAVDVAVDGSPVGAEPVKRRSLLSRLRGR